jgi:hypothetical protein
VNQFPPRSEILSPSGFYTMVDENRPVKRSEPIVSDIASSRSELESLAQEEAASANRITAGNKNRPETVSRC